MINDMGKLIKQLRKDKNMTQLELANKLHISDKAISKWERSAGLPDISLIKALAEALDTDEHLLLSGVKESCSKNSGNLNKSKFYICKKCQNVLFQSGNASISCCSSKLKPQVAQEIDENHKITVKTIENDYYITFSHEMKKEHYISFAAFITDDKMFFQKMYAEQSSSIRFQKFAKGTLYFYCTNHGLFKVNIG